ncbi:barstar family protein [Kibdelosporangium philippinense]|uniref:Barstar family protein n=1 Tax=Kibdelosporangium philippinense TaxID=211113 RepID=A0ABS8ZV32_9PSEU|nr:barstar family protein [Kibdelosporangium philippinense]MCE7011600.1 barstar family protein [Kibdelosporangium philippinense]
MRYVLDGSKIRTKSAMLDALAKTMSFPDYFGHNLDALADVLYDLPKGEHTLVWQSPETLRKADPDNYEQFVDILGNADRLTLVLAD